MKTVLLDSSVWMSLLVRDTQSRDAQKIWKTLQHNNFLILVPVVVYSEVINNIMKFDSPNNELLERTKSFFWRRRDVRIIIPDKHFWLQKIEKYAKLVNLKTLDLLILSFAFEFHVRELYSFDRKLLNAYKSLKLKHAEV